LEKPKVIITVYAEHPCEVAELHRLLGIDLNEEGGSVWSASVDARLEVRRDEAGRKSPSSLRLRISQ